ncbi:MULTISPECIES: ABC transporter permease [unclassified Caballeronia]|uniref:ABC transporter permease n=1 Tax=unclassified Caballeronia TaxID=2646786 RepID=UPI00285EE036|nr:MULTISPECIES: ABC transporter permease [unclassified Caballeronia]MDR5818326.1 ABC transporter permease [Caballeronia sp. LZ033]MDR5825293.1 ABC transporter permease [Caballeronia sp. LZ043]
MNHSAATPESSSARTQRAAAASWWTAARRFNTVAILVVLVIAASFVSSDFLSVPNLANISRQVAGVGIMSVGMLLVVLTGGIDLSVGSVAALGSVLCALLIPEHGLWFALLATLLTGALCGFVSGALVAWFRLTPFVVTLAMMTVARGIALIVSNGSPILVDDPGQALLDFGRHSYLGIPGPTLVMLLVFVGGGIALNRLRAGRVVRAIGSNEEAVRLSGVPVARHVLGTYVASGVLAAMAGIISTSRAGVGAPTVGVGDELTVIAAVVIGGASLAGGKGGALNTLMGVLILGVIGNIMNLASVPGYHQQVVMGVIIVAAVLSQRGGGFWRRFSFR